MNRANLSDYTYHVRRDGERPVIVIVDLNLGRMSVTNNIEDVVGGVCKETGLTPNKAEIIYRDSDGIYDGVLEHEGQLHFYSPKRNQRIKNEDEAVAAVLANNNKC